LLRSERRYRFPGAKEMLASLSSARLGEGKAIPGLADGPLHLELDEAVQFHRILHWQLLDDRLDEAAEEMLVAACTPRAPCCVRWKASAKQVLP